MIILATIIFLFYIGPGAFWVSAILGLALSWIFKGTRFGEICYIIFKVCDYIAIAASAIAILVGLAVVFAYICR